MDSQYFGHATFLIVTKGKKLLFDPFNHKEYASKTSPDYILNTNAHKDYIEGVLEIANWFKEESTDNIYEINIGRASNYNNCSNIVGMHLNTFHTINVDKKNTEIAFKNAGKKLILPAKGKSFKL